MLRNAERIPLDEIEERIRRFGPLTSNQIKKHFALAGHTSLGDKLKSSAVLRWVCLGSHGQLITWYHRDGRKPEGSQNDTNN